MGMLLKLAQLVSLPCEVQWVGSVGAQKLRVMGSALVRWPSLCVLNPLGDGLHSTLNCILFQHCRKPPTSLLLQAQQTSPIV